MAPEQARGDRGRASGRGLGRCGPGRDRRADGVQTPTEEAVWRGTIDEPSGVGDTAWVPTCARRSRRARDNRHPRAARARPRPGRGHALHGRRRDPRGPTPACPFTEADAEDFFGREAEIEAMWQKMRRRQLLAVIGPSGAGKSSCCGRAGPTRRRAGARSIAKPGRAPVLALAQALATGAAGDAEAMRAARASRTRTWRSGLVRAGAAGTTRPSIVGRPVRGAVHPEPARGPGGVRELLGGSSTRTSTCCSRCATTSCSSATRHAELAPIFRELTCSGPPPGRRCGGPWPSPRSSAATASRRGPGRRDGGPGGGGAGGAAAAGLRGVAAVGAARPGARAADAGGVRRDRRRGWRAGAARRGDAGADRGGARADGAGAVPQPGDRAGDAGAWTGTSCCRSSRGAAAGRGRRPSEVLGPSSTRAC